MPGNSIVIVGASSLGCELALEARKAGLPVTLIDEHPQSIKAMSNDAPYFYGNGLPAALQNRVAVNEAVLGSNERLIDCLETGVDVRTGTVAWGAFQSSPNNLHVGQPKVGIVTGEGNELVAYDHLVIAAGARDFVPSFRGWELPGVFGVKAGRKLLTSYQCYDGTRTLILGTTAEAVAFAREAREKGVEIAGFVEPGSVAQTGADDLSWIKSEAIEIFFGTVIEGANGKTSVTSASLVSTSAGGDTHDIACDTICAAVGTLPNIELPSAMGCELAFSTRFGTWLPATSASLETTRPNVYWLSSFTRGSGQARTILAAIQGHSEPLPAAAIDGDPERSPADYLRLWIKSLLRAGGRNVSLCQCETVTRGELLDLSPPKYLGQGLRRPKSPILAAAEVARIDQDAVKRMTRVGMGHCQGKRCRDEAALLLSEETGVPLERIKPATYRFPVRPIDLVLIAAEDDTPDTRELWPHWLEPYVQQAGE